MKFQTLVRAFQIKDSHCSVKTHQVKYSERERAATLSHLLISKTTEISMLKVVYKLYFLSPKKEKHLYNQDAFADFHCCDKTP